MLGTSLKPFRDSLKVSKHFASLMALAPKSPTAVTSAFILSEVVGVKSPTRKSDMISPLLPACWLFRSALADLGMYSQSAGTHNRGLPDVENIHTTGYPRWSSSVYLVMAWLGVIWYCFVWLVCSIGCLEMSVLHYPLLWYYTGSNKCTGL